jgi:hypothetical protein
VFRTYVETGKLMSERAADVPPDRRWLDRARHLVPYAGMLLLTLLLWLPFGFKTRDSWRNGA